MKLVQLNKDLREKTAQIKSLIEKADYSAEDEKTADALQVEADAIVAEIELEQKRDGRSARLKALDAYQNEPVTKLPQPGDELEGDTHGQNAVPTTARKSSSVRSFRGPDADKKAYQFGTFVLAAFGGNEKARAYCKKHGMAITKGQNEGGNSSDGGVLVPTQFDNDMIVLREEFGVFRANAKVKTMTSDSLSVPRRKNGLKAIPVGESQRGEQSKMGWDRVSLTARKWMVLTKSSAEFNEDSIIEVGDELFGEINYAFAETEDECGFLGDGTGAFHRIVGLQQAFLGLSDDPTKIAGLVVASTSDWNAIPITEFTRLTGRLPAYAYKRKNVKWYCSQSFWSGVFQRIAIEAGGNAVANLVAGVENQQFMGYPVEISQALPIVPTAKSIPLYFGDLREAVIFGDRRQTTLSMSEHSAFEEDEIEYKGTERFDINCHGVGTAGATAKDRKAGPLVAFYTS